MLIILIEMTVKLFLKTFYQEHHKSLDNEVGFNNNTLNY